MTTDAVRTPRSEAGRRPVGEGRVGVLWREAPPYFDDLEIGAAMESSGRTVTEHDVVSFAALTGDWHPQHADADWAERSPFGRRIAHGMLVISYALGLLPIDPRVVLALRSIESAVLKRPVGLGDTIRVRAEVAKKRELSGESGLVSLRVRIVNQSDQLAARMEMTVLWRREPGESLGDEESIGPDDAPATPGVDHDDALSPIQDGRLLV